MRKHRVRAFGLAIMSVLGLMAFAAASVQAADLDLIMNPNSSGSTGIFLSNNGTEAPTGLTKEEITGTQIGSGVMSIPGKSAEIVCEEGNIVAGAESYVQNEYENYLAAAGTMIKGGHGHATLLFKKCVVNSINNVTHALTGSLGKCTEELNKATTPGDITAKTLVLVRKHEGETFLLFEPLIASKADDEAVAALTKPFTTIKFGGTCSLPPTVNITGGVCVKVPATDSTGPKIKIETVLNDAFQKLCGAKLAFGGVESYIKGEAEVKLVNKPALIWGAM